jgi:hypothetical protein
MEIKTNYKEKSKDEKSNQVIMIFILCSKDNVLVEPFYLS